jgi:hypothetical protein
MFRQGLELLAVQYGLSQRDYHRKRKIEQTGWCEIGGRR